MLGEGGFGRTYLATDRARANAAERTEADEFCEIQEFIPTSQIPGAVTKAKEFFKQQAILLYQLQHPQVPRFWATFEEQGRLFLVLDYIEGKTYGQLLEDRRDDGGALRPAPEDAQPPTPAGLALGRRHVAGDELVARRG